MEIYPNYSYNYLLVNGDKTNNTDIVVTNNNIDNMNNNSTTTANNSLVDKEDGFNSSQEELDLPSSGRVGWTYAAAVILFQDMRERQL